MWLRPDLIVDTVTEVTPERLRGLGVRGALVDLDDTLVASNSETMTPAVRRWFAGLRRAGLALLIFSNGNRSRVARWSRELKVDGVALAGKPFTFRRALARLGTRPRETAMIGDQLFTDVLGANAAGLLTVLVRPLSPGRLPHTRAARRLERLILEGGDHGRSVHR